MSGTVLSASNDRVALVTGAAGGIGRSLVARLVSDDYRVWATDCDPAALCEIAQCDRWPAERVHSGTLDVRDRGCWLAAVAGVLERWGRLDVLLNVAGVIRPGYIFETTADDVALHLDVNIKGVILGTQAVLEPMRRQQSGHIVNVASLAAIAAIPGLSLYSASKFAVRGFSLAIAPELRREGIYVTVVCPDAVATAMVDLQLAYPQAALTFSGRRLLVPGEVAQLVAGRVLRRRPLEVTYGRTRGWVAKLTSLWPGLALRLLPRLERRGRRRQERARRAREAAGGGGVPAP